jgi:hypothetical protein
MGWRTINPPLGLGLVGYPSERPNTGVGLDLCVRAAVFAAPDAPAPQAALLVLDVIGVRPPLLEHIRAACSEAVPGLPSDAVMVAATHTHSGPTLGRSRRKGGEERVPDPDYIEQVVAASASAAADGWKARRLVRMRFGTAEAKLAHNRRVVDADGIATNVWLDDGTHDGYFVPDVPFVLFEDAEEGNACWVVASYGCHPVTLGPRSDKVSPDYPGYFVRKLESQTGARTAMFITGGGGNINPKTCITDNPAEAERMGGALADEVVGAMADAQPVDGVPVVAASVPLDFVLSPNAAERHAERATESADGKHVTTEVQAIGVGGLAFVSAPGELFAEIAAQMRELSPFEHTIVVAYANDGLGYLPTDEAQSQGGHEVNHAASRQVEKPLLAAAEKALQAAMAKRESAH